MARGSRRDVLRSGFDDGGSEDDGKADKGGKATTGEPSEDEQARPKKAKASSGGGKAAKGGEVTVGKGKATKRKAGEDVAHEDTDDPAIKKQRSANWTEEEDLVLVRGIKDFEDWVKTVPGNKKPSKDQQAAKLHSFTAPYGLKRDAGEMAIKKKNLLAMYRAVNDESKRDGSSGKLIFDLSGEQLVHEALDEIYFRNAAVNPEAVAAVVELAADEEHAAAGGSGADKADKKSVVYVAGFGVRLAGDHNGRLRQSTGKAGGAGMALIAALQDLSSKNDRALQNMAICMGDLASGMRSMNESLAFELRNQQNARLAAAKARHLQVSTYKTEIEIIQMLKAAGGISETDAQQRLNEIARALL
ncbi:hypothetical protein PLESTB_000464700 [Pleodorina starrii]|uniref:Uncharacterized protein n=1 Tax=Pleodorina starrii TaxID=330485 RepID=A0A9W6EZI1_9CHLO|nr:hypothetical protein PLESTB_000464700 [Pleodorina starrii]